MHSDGKKELIASSYSISNRPSSHKIEPLGEYIRFVVSAQKGDEILERVEISTRGRRSVNSGIIDLISQRLPPTKSKEEPTSIKLEEPELAEERHSSSKRPATLYNRLGLGKPRSESPKLGVNDKRIPELLLPGQMIYCKDMGRLCVIPPPPRDNKKYVLVMQNTIPYWQCTEEISEKDTEVLKWFDA